MPSSTGHMTMLILAIVLLQACQSSPLLGTWQCDGSGLFYYLDSDRQLDSISLSRYYKESTVTPIVLQFDKHGSGYITAYEPHAKNRIAIDSFSFYNNKINEKWITVLDRYQKIGAEGVTQIHLETKDNNGDSFTGRLDFLGESITIKTKFIKQ